jgi:hypothetical protein
VDLLFRQADPPGEVLRIQHRLRGIEWMPTPDQVLVTEYDRDRRWTVTAQLDLSKPRESRKVLFDRSANSVFGGHIGIRPNSRSDHTDHSLNLLAK